MLHPNDSESFSGGLGHPSDPACEPRGSAIRGAVLVCGVVLVVSALAYHLVPAFIDSIVMP